MLGVPLHYWWWVLALILIAGEVLAPGFFLLWIGIAAAVMGIATWVLPGMDALALPAGARIEVIGVDGALLKVRSAAP